MSLLLKEQPCVFNLLGSLVLICEHQALHLGSPSPTA